MADSTTPTSSSETQVYLGVAIEINNKVITLEPKKAISNIKQYGLEVGLPKGTTVNLGTVGNGIDSILGTISQGTTLPKKEDVPQVLQSTWETLTNAEITITSFHVMIPGTETKIPNTQTKETTTRFTAGLSATWEGDKGHLVGTVNIKGIYVEVSNEKPSIDTVIAPSG
jgi:hypothetical protein